VEIDMMEVEQRVTTLIAAALKVPNKAVDLDLDLRSQGLDSISMIDLAVSVQREFGVDMFQLDSSAQDMRTARAIVQYVSKRLPCW
jgi:acyl carrier protein